MLIFQFLLIMQRSNTFHMRIYEHSCDWYLQYEQRSLYETYWEQRIYVTGLYNTSSVLFTRRIKRSSDCVWTEMQEFKKNRHNNTVNAPKVLLLNFLISISTAVMVSYLSMSLHYALRYWKSHITTGRPLSLHWRKCLLPVSSESFVIAST
jgi:hypothetical protein